MVRALPNSLPDIDGYREAVATIHLELQQTPVARAALERIDRALSGDSVTCLLCSDNGSGLTTGEYQRLLSEAMSGKVGAHGAGKLGSVGVGHLTALDASDLRYVLYASRSADGQVFGGQAMLASQLHQASNERGEDVHRVRQGCLTAERHIDGFRGYKASPADPASTPASMLGALPERGTTVAIVAYNSRDEDRAAVGADGDLASDPHLDRIFNAVAKHFMVALTDRRLKVIYASWMRAQSGLDDEEVGRRLETNRGRRQANRRGYGSGAKAWAAWETLTKGTQVSIEDGSLWYRLTPGETTTVAVFRNGMRITDDAPRLRSQNFRGFRAFSAVLDADGDLALAIKECETDSHLEIKPAQAPGDYGKRATNGLQAVQDALKAAAGELDTDEWVPDVLRIFNDENAPKKVESAPPRPAAPQPDAPQPPLPTPGPEPGPAPPGPAPGPGPGPTPGPEPKPYTDVQPQTWRPGSTSGVRRTLVPVGDTQAVVEWEFADDRRKPASVGVAVVVGSGSQPSDRRPAPDEALPVRLEGGDDTEWVYELKVSASTGSARVDVRDAPPGWEAVTAIVSRRS